MEQAAEKIDIELDLTFKDLPYKERKRTGMATGRKSSSKNKVFICTDEKDAMERKNGKNLIMYNREGTLLLK